MLSDAEELRKIKDISQRYSGSWKGSEVVSFDDDKMLQFHKKMKSVAERMLKDDVNLDEENLVFVLSEEPGIGAAYCHGLGNDETPDGFIYFTADLLKFCDNEDQLAFVLAHELEHFKLRKQYGSHVNAKPEETVADIRAIDKMVKAGMNLEEASKIAEKIFTSSNVTLHDIMDEHLSGENRISLVKARVTAEKDRLRRAELASPDVTEDVTHPMDKDILYMANHLPHKENLRDFFESAEFKKASTEKKIDLWFEKFEQELTVHKKVYNSKYLNETVYSYSMSSLSRKVLQDYYFQLCDKMNEEREPWNDFAYKAIMSCYKEENRSLMKSKAEVMKMVFRDNDLGYSDGDVIGRDLGDVFKGFREAEGDKVQEMLDKLRVLEALFSYYDRADLVQGRILELDYGETDIGKKFSKEIFKEEKNLIGNYFKITELPNREMVILDGDNAILVDAEGKLQEIDTNALQFKEKFIARQINEMVQKLKNIQDGMPIDEESKLKTLMKAWQMNMPVNGRKSSQGDVILFEKQLEALGFTLLEGVENKGGFPLLVGDMERYLTDDAKAFFREKFSYPNEEDMPYTKYIREELLKSFDALKDNRNTYFMEGDIGKFLEAVSALKYEDTSPADMSFEIPYERQLPFLCAVMKSVPSAFSSVTFERLTDTLLEKHLAAGKSLDDFEFLTSLEKAPISIEGSCMKYELLKKEPNIDLSLISEVMQDNYWSFLVYGMPGKNIKDEKVKEILKARIKENIDKPENWRDDKNWGAGSEDFWVFKDRVDNISFAHKFYIAMEKAKNSPEMVELFQDVALRFYQEGSVTEKKLYLAKALSYTQPVESDVLKRSEFNKKCAKVFYEDFNNPRISVQDKVTLFHALYENRLFDEHYQVYFGILFGKDKKSGLLKEIEDADISQSERTKIYMSMLDKSHRIPDPEVRAEVVHRAAHSWWLEQGKYDDTKAIPKERDEFILKAQKLGEGFDIPITENEALRREIAEITLAQEDLSFELKPINYNVDIQDRKTLMAAYGLDGISYMLSEGVIKRDTVSSFLLGGDQAADIHKARMALLDDVNKAYVENKWALQSFYEKVTGHYTGNIDQAYDAARNMLTSDYLIVAKKEFDAAPLEAKALILQMVSGSNDWEKNFKQISDKLFEGAGDLSKIGKDFLESYISSRDESERCLYLAAIYAAANSNEKSALAENGPYTSEQRALARGLRLFLENSDTPGIKLAQAISSYPDAPGYIRDEMQLSKTQANPPARWTVFEWLNQQHTADKTKYSALNSELIKDVKLKEEARDDLGLHGRLGKRKGSASSFVTYEFITRDQERQIVKIKRNGMEEMSEAEFKVYREMLKKMSKKYPWARSLGFLVDNAASMVAVEGNLTIGEQQLRDAQKLYPKTAESDGVSFNVKVMDWTARGENWAMMEEAKGVDFKDLEQPYKKAAAKAVFTMELANMLSGKRFDADRHAGQYKFDTSTDTIGLFDTGSLSVVEPTEKEKKVLGIVLANTVKSLMDEKGGQLSGTLCAEIDKGIARFYDKEIKAGKSIPPYLSEFQRGLLALTDFHKEIPDKELGVCLMQALNNGKHQLDKAIYKGFTQQMFETKADKAVGLKQGLQTIVELTGKEKAEMLPEAKAARKIGQLMAEKMLSCGDVYEGLTQIPQKMKRAEMLEIIGSKCGKIQFGKGVLHTLFDKINPKRYDILERRKMGAQLYFVIKEMAKAQKENRKVSISEVFCDVSKKHGGGSYGQEMKNILQLADSLNLSSSLDSFKKSVVFGRMIDGDVQQGYITALRGDKDVGPIKKALSYIHPLNMIPKESSKKIMKYAVKTLAPYCLKALQALEKIKDKKQKSAGVDEADKSR